MFTAVGTQQERRCSFCGKPQNEVGHLLTGVDEHAFICRPCLSLHSSPEIDRRIIEDMFRQLESKLADLVQSGEAADQVLRTQRELAESLQEMGKHIESIMKGVGIALAAMMESERRLEAEGPTLTLKQLWEISPDQVVLIPQHQSGQFLVKVLGIPTKPAYGLLRRWWSLRHVLSASEEEFMMAGTGVIGKKTAEEIVRTRDEYLARWKKE